MTEELFRADAYLRRARGRVMAVGAGVVRLDRTVCYPQGGGQPGDTGWLRFDDGSQWRIGDTRTSETGNTIEHHGEHPPDRSMVGCEVEVEVEWPRRHRLMRMHTLLHLLCALVPAGVTGGSVRDGSGRLDFDLPESTLDKLALGADLNRLVSEDHPVRVRWISDQELAARPELVRTMAVEPPSGTGHVRLVDIEGVDLQPCGGTHVAATGEIGPVRVRKIEKKGRHNRRVTVAFDDD